MNDSKKPVSKTQTEEQVPPTESPGRGVMVRYDAEDRALAYRALSMEPSAMQELVEANFGGGAIPANSLSRITAPLGGATRWELEGELTDTFSGVILGLEEERVLFQLNRPICINGVGTPGGDCQKCPKAKSECRKSRYYLLVREGKLLPERLRISLMSLRAADDYQTALVSDSLHLWDVVTSFRLERRTNPDGNPYARVVFRCERVLQPAERERAQQLSVLFRGLCSPNGAKEVKD